MSTAIECVCFFGGGKGGGYINADVVCYLDLIKCINNLNIDKEMYESWGKTVAQTIIHKLRGVLHEIESNRFAANRVT